MRLTFFAICPGAALASLDEAQTPVSREQLDKETWLINNKHAVVGRLAALNETKTRLGIKNFTHIDANRNRFIAAFVEGLPIPVGTTLDFDSSAESTSPILYPGEERNVTMRLLES